MSETLFDKHQETLQGALTALAARDYWSAYPEVPSGKIYGETAKADGQKAFEARLNKRFVLNQPGCDGAFISDKVKSGVFGEISPYGMNLGIDYPRVNINELLPAMQAQIPAWRDAGIEVRTGICLEILQRLNQASFELGYSVMHTSGQGFVMAFQAGGPHAQDRGLEGLAYAYKLMTDTPTKSSWIKPQGRAADLSVDKSYHIVPKGVSLLIACTTFPTWNSYPGLFASLVSGDPVVVKPHPRAILPLAITVEIAQQVLQENGFAPHLVSLVADTDDAPMAKKLALRPQVKLIDFTGSSAFGEWLEANAVQAKVYTEKGGVNSIVLDSCDDLDAVIKNWVFSLCLYSGQMCTTPQNIFIPEQGIMTAQGLVSFDQVGQKLADGMSEFLSDPQRAAEVLGCIISKKTLKRIEKAASKGDVILASKAHQHPQFPDAILRSPLLLKMSVNAQSRYMKEHFGPIVMLIATSDTTQSIELATQSAKTKGAITWAVYSSDEAVLDAMELASLDAGVSLSCNLNAGLYVNQSAAFSDFHATGANPAANASLTDANFVAGRFSVVQNRRHST